METIKNIVLVHGAFVDGSGWRGVYEILRRENYNVTIVHNALTSLEDGIKATETALDKQDGPCVLVGHSYGGAIITEAGNPQMLHDLCIWQHFSPIMARRLYNSRRQLLLLAGIIIKAANPFEYN